MIKIIIIYYYSDVIIKKYGISFLVEHMDTSINKTFIIIWMINSYLKNVKPHTYMQLKYVHIIYHGYEYR